MRHCLINAMSEGRLSAHSNVTSDRPARTDLSLEKNEKEAANIIHGGTIAAFHG